MNSRIQHSTSRAVVPAGGASSDHAIHCQSFRRCRMRRSLGGRPPGASARAACVMRGRRPACMPSVRIPLYHGTGEASAALGFHRPNQLPASYDLGVAPSLSLGLLRLLSSRRPAVRHYSANCTPELAASYLKCRRLCRAWPCLTATSTRIFRQILAFSTTVSAHSSGLATWTMMLRGRGRNFMSMPRLSRPPGYLTSTITTDLSSQARAST